MADHLVGITALVTWRTGSFGDLNLFRKLDVDPHRTPPPSKDKPLNFRPPKTWKMTEDEWDSNKVYGLTLPRIVANNRCTREIGIEGLPVFDVALVSVIGQQHENWALRMMAHGRRASRENFRSRQESVFAGVLLRLIRGDLVSPDGQDFVTIMNAEHKKRHPQKELHDWVQKACSGQG